MAMSELEIPSGVPELEESDEFLRFWIGGGEDYVSLRVGAMGEREVQQWGMILADISDHIIRAIKQQGNVRTEGDIRAEMEHAYLERLKVKDRNISGSLIGSKQ
jgi:hypothetical protein